MILIKIDIHLSALKVKALKEKYFIETEDFVGNEDMHGPGIKDFVIKAYSI